MHAEDLVQRGDRGIREGDGEASARESTGT